MESLNRFLGLNNIADPMRGTDPGMKTAQTWEWQSTADNVDGTDSDSLQRREGYQPFLTATITGSYSTFDYSRMYVIANGALCRVNADSSMVTLFSGLAGPFYWAEINDVVYLSCSAQLEIHKDNTVSLWGVPIPTPPTLSATNGTLFAGRAQVCLTYSDAAWREGGACTVAEIDVGGDSGVTVSNIPQLADHVANIYMTEPDGTVFYHTVSTRTDSVTIKHNPSGKELTTQFLDTPPSGGYIAFMGANAYVAEYDPAQDSTVIWFSQPMGYHLFNLNSDYFIVPGEVTQLHGSQNGLVIATQNRIFIYNNDQLLQVAEYGAVPGQHADLGNDGKTYFWSKRGLCRAAPFENLTEGRMSIAPGVQAGGGVISKGGYTKYVAILHTGGNAFNSRST